jgi:protein-S-isoprenylcysteine O-methyltransferase Ste14
MSGKPDRAPIIAPPPLLGLLCIVAGFVAKHFKPLPLFTAHAVVRIVVGICLVAISAAVIIVARQQFIAHGTHPNPYRPTAAVVTSGLYRFSRNPIYLAFLLIVIAFAFFANSIWFFLSALLLFLILHAAVVRREERYLAGKFGESYAGYCRQVRRWI